MEVVIILLLKDLMDRIFDKFLMVDVLRLILVNMLFMFVFVLLYILFILISMLVELLLYVFILNLVISGEI